MRHRIFGKQLSRTKNERKRLFEGLVRDVIMKGTITTTITKAKAVQPMIEKLVTSARKNTGASVHGLRKVLRDHDVYTKFIADSGRFGDRTSGFTRIIKIGPRKGDAAEMVRFGFVEMSAAPSIAEKQSAGSKLTKAVKLQKVTKASKPKVQKRVEKPKRAKAVRKTV